MRSALSALAFVLVLTVVAEARAEQQFQANFNGMQINNQDAFLKAIQNLPLDAAQKAQIMDFFKNAQPGNVLRLPKGALNNQDAFQKALQNLPLDATQKAQIKDVFKNAQPGNVPRLPKGPLNNLPLIKGLLPPNEQDPGKPLKGMLRPKAQEGKPLKGMLRPKAQEPGKPLKGMLPANARKPIANGNRVLPARNGVPAMQRAFNRKR